ncbi:STAS domain-containing protein [Persephonella sp.]|uniref:STAS domain-containing protein n=1 Tax=Persephonella sp. TaxID=2060922 RepID=UPI00262159F3|nr:STAS domain-containing protein [Persephonella sp.]
MEYTKKGNQLIIRLEEDFNYPVVKRMESLVNMENIDSLVIDLTGSKLVDSEAVKLMYMLLKEGIDITLVNPPEILDKILDILELKDEFKNISIVRESR